MRVVLDTNIVVSRFLSPHGAPAQIVALWEQRAFEVLLSSEILAEYKRALSYESVRKRHGFTIEDIERWVDNANKQGRPIIPGDKPVNVSRDPDDNKFLECALAGGADYIVSGDAHLLNIGQYEGIQILSPAAFLRILVEAQS